MLYSLNQDYTELKPIPFEDFESHGQLEKQLEELIAKHLFDRLFEGVRIMPFFQERSYQPEADIYALNEQGEVVIFELKRSAASGDALDQVLRYAQEVGRWTYADIGDRLRRYEKNEYGDLELALAHMEAFSLSTPLREDQFNREQHMYVIGSAADARLRDGVDYWRQKGLSIDFIPYRLYRVGDELFFEFFSKPYDTHANPAHMKGVLFDTCRSYFPHALKWMVEKRRISAYGDRKEAVYSLSPSDIVFYSHRWQGLVAAARITGRAVKQDRTPDGYDELFWDVEFLTDVPSDFECPHSMAFKQVKEVTGKNFFWARIQKTPYLNHEEAEHLLTKLQEELTNTALEGPKE